MSFFILIKTNPAMEHKVHDEIKFKPGVEYACILFGEFDILAKVNLDREEFSSFISKVRIMPGVFDTKVLSGMTT